MGESEVAMCVPWFSFVTCDLSHNQSHSEENTRINVKLGLQVFWFSGRNFSFNLVGTLAKLLSVKNLALSN